MKKVLLASSALVFSTGYAVADVAVSGDGRLGIVDSADSYSFADDEVTEGELDFNSRIRIGFSASGETDGGIAFGGSIRADNSESGASGTAGSIFISSAFGKLSMGDVSGAAEQAVGDVSGVGYTGLGDFNENIYLSNNTDTDATDADSSPFDEVRPVALYEYSFGDGTVYVSAGNPGASFEATGDDLATYGIGGTYTFSGWTVGLGWETLDIDGSPSVDHIVAGVSGAIGDATIKATYGDASEIDLTQWALSLDYVFGATTATIFYRDLEAELDSSLDFAGWGVGVSYDLGGGAALAAGYVDVDDNNDDTSDGAWDLGLTFSF